MIGTISPVSTIILAMIILSEPFTAADATGTALVIAGIAIFLRIMTRDGKLLA